MARQQSPWEIGRTYYDQTDLYTRDSSIDASGYGLGPSFHPPEGSYAYHREPSFGPIIYKVGDATLYEREAWPWLNYRGPEDEPYFSHLHDHDGASRGLFSRLRAFVSRFIGPGAYYRREDKRIQRDVSRAFDFRADLDTTDIELSVHNGRVTLEGTVPDLRSKRLAEETAGGIHGVTAVINRLTIRTDDPTDATPVFVSPLAY